jgi:hypothetical protein
MTNPPPTDPIRVRAEDRQSRQGELWFLEEKYKNYKIVKEPNRPYRREADGYDYWVFVAPIRIGWFVPDDPGKDREKVQSVWQQEAKEKPVVTNGVKCWMPTKIS